MTAMATRQILFIQGAGEGTHDEWDNRLVASLERALGPDHEVRYPRMPGEDDPTFATWSARLEREIAQLDHGCILVGHSVGGAVLVHTLAARPALSGRVAAICLVAAPFVGDGGWPSDEVDTRGDWAAPLAGIPVHLYHGDADDTVPMAHLDLYAKAMPHAHVHRLEGRDHQLNDDLSEVAADIGRIDEPA